MDDLLNSLVLFVFGAVIGAFVFAVSINAAGRSPRDFRQFEAQAIEHGYAKQCIGDVVVWADMSCEK